MRFEEMTKDKKDNKVQKANSFMLGVVYYGIRIYCFLCGVRVKTVNCTLQSWFLC